VSIQPSNNTGGRLIIKSKGSNYKQYIASSTTATSELTFTLPNVAGELATVEKVNSLGYMTRSTADSLYLTKSTADSSYMTLNPSAITLKSGDNSIKFQVNDSGEFLVNGKLKSLGIISSSGLSVTGSTSLGQLAAGTTLLSSLNV
jgi:hypothetical protein